MYSKQIHIQNVLYTLSINMYVNQTLLKETPQPKERERKMIIEL